MRTGERLSEMQADVSGQPTVRRPPDRKARIIGAAGPLFRERGYHNVSVADVAAEVGITAPAVYRHFRGKPDLLLQVVTATIERIADTARSAPDLESYLRSSATQSIERRGASILWQREARHLPAERREELRRALADIAARVATLISDARPGLTGPDAELLAWAVMSAYGSISGHRVSLPRRRFETVLYGLGHATAFCALGAPGAVREAAPDAPARGGYAALALSRREEILVTAIQLFDERGFQSVSTDDIGEAAGASGPSIYKHFPSKADLLVAAVVRGGEQRRAGTAQALAGASGPRDTLLRLLRSYVEFALRESHLIGVLVGELDQLPEKERKSARQEQRDYLALWVRLLDGTRPGLDAAEARITVNAVLTTVDNAARTGRLGRRSDIADRLTDLGASLLLSEDEAQQ